MIAEYLSYVKSIATFALIIFGYNISVLVSVPPMISIYQFMPLNQLVKPADISVN